MIQEKVTEIKLATVSDLARLASSMVSMGSAVYLIHFNYHKKHYYGLLATFRDYYKNYGVPLFYFIERDEPLKGKYLAIKVDETGEKVECIEGVKAGWICIPIVSLDEKPVFISLEKGDR